MPTPDRAARGAAAEDAALRFLTARGLQLIECNFRARGGELDLVMDERGTVVIIEVRARVSDSHGSAAATVDVRKQQRIVNATRVLLQQRPALAQCPLRFDVVTFDGAGSPQWIKAAFDATD